MTQPGPTAATQPLTWDAVIATRNRPEALELSIPLLLNQTRLPEKLIIIDSSEDHSAVAEVVARTTAGWNRPVIVEHAGPGLPYQRNLGLRHVTADVVIFPDDDSLFFAETAQKIMEIYEADRDGIVAGVCGQPVEIPPEGVLPKSSYEMSKAHKSEARTQRLRNRLEKSLPHFKPALFLGTLFSSRYPVPAWFDPARHSIVEYMTGFRMSFRTSVIKTYGFDETLRGYGLDEDVEASLAVARDGLLVGAREAGVYHHRNPSGRGDSYSLGATTVLNRVYVISKHIVDGNLSPEEARAVRSRLRWFIRLKLLAEIRLLLSAAGRARWRGAWLAARQAHSLMHAPRAGLSEAYTQAQLQLGL